MLSANNIFYSIGKKQILKDVSTVFKPGEFNIILGPNGSGKSTLLKILSGELSGYKGAVLYNNQNLTTLKIESLAKYRAVMSQQPDLGFPLSVDEVVMMGRYPHFNFAPDKKDFDICNEVIASLYLSSFKERNYLTLSGGEKQRVQFARVLAQIWEKESNGIRYLFLDEPLNSLDIKYQQAFLKMVKSFADKNTILVAVLHDINLAIQYADNLIFLKEGKLKSQGKPKDILSPALLKEIFDLETSVVQNPSSGKLMVIYS